jgi:hypothetical protein
MPPNGQESISSITELYTPTPPPIYDNCGHRLETEGPEVSPIPNGDGTVIYTWAFLDCNRKEVYWTYKFIIGSGNSSSPIFVLGNTEVFTGTTTAANRRALPFTFYESGDIQSITIYHNGGKGHMLLGVYLDDSGKPGTLLGVTASTPISSTQGWQTVTLTNPVAATAGQTVWLAWVFETSPGVRYAYGTPGRAQSLVTWSGGMPETFGTSSVSGIKYSIYCTYVPGSSKESKSAEILTPSIIKVQQKVYPNPFTDRLFFEFVSSNDVYARIDLYDMNGRLVKTIFEQPVEADQYYQAEFKPETTISAFYVYRIILGNDVRSGKVIYKNN